MKLTGNIQIIMRNPTSVPFRVIITDNVYKSPALKKVLHPADKNIDNVIIPIDLSKNFGWYDFTIKIVGNDLFEKRYAGRVETGEQGFSDPFMGQII